jgi:hypothetical protein
MAAISKIDRPPAAENWVRMQHPNVDQTTRAVFNFLRGSPTFNYSVGKSAARAKIEDQIPRKMAEEMVLRSKGDVSRKFNLELIRAFLDYEELNPIDGVKAFDEYSENFMLSRSIWIPVRPLTVIREAGSFTPIFLCPWSRVSLDTYQASLLMTILEDVVFSHTDFEDSEGKILFFPKVPGEFGTMFRKPMIWKRGQFPLLSKSDLTDQIRIFLESKNLATVLYQDYLNKKEKR